jgi:hypothetical protein
VSLIATVRRAGLERQGGNASLMKPRGGLRAQLCDRAALTSKHYHLR